MERYRICQGCNREYQGNATRSRRDHASLICEACAKLEEFQELLLLGGKPPRMNLQVIWEHLILYV